MALLELDEKKSGDLFAIESMEMTTEWITVLFKGRGACKKKVYLYVKKIVHG